MVRGFEICSVCNEEIMFDDSINEQHNCQKKKELIPIDVVEKILYKLSHVHMGTENKDKYIYVKTESIIDEIKKWYNQ